MTTAIRREAPHHNTLTCVKDYNCWLPDCRDRYKAYQRTRYHAITAGTWEPLVDAAPVRQHLTRLYAAGFSPNRIGELTGLPYETVIGFTQVHGFSGKRRSRKRRCNPETAAKILAVQPGEHLPGKTDATGTQRRIQALVAAGWPLSHLGPRFGLSERTTGALLTQDRVYGRTAEKVTRVYNELADQKPAKHGISRRSITRSKARAQRNRWATVGYWATRADAIDDPHFTPDYKVTKAEMLAEETRWLIETVGLTRTEAAERLGKDRSYIDQVLGQTELKAAA